MMLVKLVPKTVVQNIITGSEIKLTPPVEYRGKETGEDDLLNDEHECRGESTIFLKPNNCTSLEVYQDGRLMTKTADGFVSNIFKWSPEDGFNTSLSLGYSPADYISYTSPNFPYYNPIIKEMLEKIYKERHGEYVEYVPLFISFDNFEVYCTEIAQTLSLEHEKHVIALAANIIYNDAISSEAIHLIEDNVYKLTLPLQLHKAFVKRTKYAGFQELRVYYVVKDGEFRTDKSLYIKCLPVKNLWKETI